MLSLIADRFKISVKTIVAIGIGTAIFFLLMRFVSIPVWANTLITFQYGVLAFFAVLFGPIAAFLIGLIGHSLVDMSFGWGLWWSWIITSGIVGFGFSFLMLGVKIEEGEFASVKNIIRFVVGTVIINALGWGVIAPTLDILIYAEPASRVFTQGVITATGNAVLTAIVGTLLLLAYSKVIPKTGSLSKEE